MAGNKKPKKKYKPMDRLMLGTFGGQNKMAKASDAALPEDAKQRLHNPVDIAILKFTTGVAKFEDWVTVCFRILVGKCLAENFYNKEQDVPPYVQAVDILNKVHTRCISQENPRLSNWSMTPEEYQPLCDRITETVQMHDEVHRKHLLPIYRECNAVMNMERALFDEKFPLPAQIEESSDVRELEAVV